ncbi:SPOC like C-terminal domain-containing protein [Roridomyces roridus]|uniref:ATP-dependent DNA helicase II subunit 1 n=1 Tax=Roridomyces roridus TaxID=1738132 RepID=A0AAD7FS22_9AGAR|nr:SPOC like C-terminal domain-containing protein [Roridomyces roridus]
MPPYDEWNKIDEEEEDELQDLSHLESKKDVILFCIDCSESMLELREDPNDPKVKTCHAYTALDAAMQIQKKKVIVGPNDLVGILLFNTTRKAESTSRTQGSEIKRNCYVYQPIGPLSAPKIQELIQLLDAFREDPHELESNFPPMTDGKRVPMGDVFTSCNWVIRDGAPKTATKRVFLITNEDDPHPGAGSKQLKNSSRTTLIDLTQAGVTVEPFFISTPDKPFDVSKFYSSVLLPDSLVDEDDVDPADPSVLPESISISRIEDLLMQMRFHESPKRALFSIPFELAKDFTIGVKGYSLVTEQKRGSYKYFFDLGERMEVVTTRTVYVDEGRQAEVDRTKMVYGTSGGTGAEGEDPGKRVVKPGQRPFYSAEDIKTFRTLGREPGLKLLGFKDLSELEFGDNVKHSNFIYPNEMSFSGSKRTFSALLKSMAKKKKIALALGVTRRNTTPMFYALLPQEERVDEAGWTDPAGFHLIPLPFADDIRSAAVERGARASESVKDAARAWIDKLSVKNGAYPPDSYPNPALAFHNAQLQAMAFGEEFNPEEFEDLSAPDLDMIHRRVGNLVEAWKRAVANDEAAISFETAKKEKEKPAKAGTKRKADTDMDMDVMETEIRSKFSEGKLNKLTMDQMKPFIKSKGMSVSGKKKADLVAMVEELLTS